MADLTIFPSLCCPVEWLRLTDTGEALVCPRGHTYRVLDGIPRFVSSSGYASAFGLQWKRQRQTQLDSYTGTQISRARLRRCLGDTLWKALAGKQVLECGCGSGRFTEGLLDQDAYVTAADLSDAIEAT